MLYVCFQNKYTKYVKFKFMNPCKINSQTHLTSGSQLSFSAKLAEVWRTEKYKYNTYNNNYWRHNQT